MDALFEDVLIDPGPYQESFKSIHVPPTLISQYERPAKSEVLCAHLSRFSSGTCLIHSSDTETLVLVRLVLISYSIDDA